MSPQTTRIHQTPTVRPATAQGGGKAGHRDTLASLVLHSAESRPGSGIVSNEHEVAEAILAAGWRPPAQVIETAEELDALQSAQGLVDDERCGHVASAAVIRDADGDVYARDVDNVLDEIREGRHAGWWQIGTGRDDIDSSTLTYPVTVLWAPENGHANA
ncbi:hypothetical protein [Nocardia sp. NPDC019302]|uniref:hypothetical protein n=1 Tax=Nocardia sp. NPDC019302 TaxID=3154592 RepID=UPI00340ECF4B